eukprot:8831207-Pyramimonas_sp.AAC.1
MGVLSSSVGAGCGRDQAPPRMPLHLPDVALQLLCDIVGEIEAQVQWPPMARKITFILKRL